MSFFRSLLFPLALLGAFSFSTALLLGSAEGLGLLTTGALGVASLALTVATVAALRKSLRSAAATTKDAFPSDWILAEFQNSTTAGFSYWERAGGKHQRSASYVSLLGIPPDAPAPISDLATIRIAPEDRPAALARVAKLQAGEDLPPETLRLQREDGTEVRLWTDARHQRDASGAVTRTLCIVRDVTHRVAAERSLRFTQFAMDHARDSMTLVATDGSRLYVNEEACRLTGRSREELIGTKIFDTIVGLEERSFKQLWQVVSHQGTHVVESLLRTHNGQIKPIEITCTFLDIDGQKVLFAVTRDISSRRAAEAALREVEGRVRLIQYALDHAQDLVSLMDSDGNRLYVNDAMCRFTGFSANELLARRVWENIPTLGETSYRELWQKIKKAGSVTLEIDVKTKEGELRPVEANCSFVVTGGVEAICTVSRDLSPRRAAEKERAHIELQFRETQKLESLGVLAGGVAHDFNNLLTGILGNASLARDRLADGDALHGPLQQIELASVRAAELCQQMLAYAGKGRVVVGPVDLSHLVTETTNLLTASVAHRATIDLRLARRLPLVQADATQMRQIIMNLVLNAAEAITHREGKITLTTGTLQIDRTFLQSARVSGGLEPGEGVYLEVKDNGSGMDEATLERAFEPFFTTKFTGRGLGLAAVIGIVRAHSGALSVSSAPGAGTTFTLVFSPEPRRRRTRPPFERQATGTTSATGNILVVDDEESVRSVASEALTRSGFKVDLAATGDGALSLLDSKEKAYDLVLLDLTMPSRDGAEILRTIRARQFQMPVVMMSGYSEDETRTRLGSLQADGFLTKPFNINGLRTRAEAAIREYRNRENQIQIQF